MASSTLRNVAYRGLATCVPKTVVSNLDDCPPAMRSERERLVRNIGIARRRICKPWQFFSTLAQDAAERLLEELAWKREDIDALIVVSQSPDYLIPATSIMIQDRMKLSTATLAFAVNLGCSGYPYALYVLGSMIAAGTVKKGLVLVGDKCATLNDPLFSDAGTATALEHDPSAPPMHFDLNSDGSGWQAIMLPVGGHRRPIEMHHHIPSVDEHGAKSYPTDLILDGTAVLSFSTQRVPPALLHTLEYAGLTLDQVDYLLLHQANRMINETIRKKLRLEPDRVPSTLEDFGNTSGASIPVTMTARIREPLLSGRKRLAMCGFGIGLSWATCIMETQGAVFPPLIEA